MAAMAVALGSVSVLRPLRGHHWVAFLCIGLQVILITLALSFLVRSKRVGESPCTDGAGPVR
ncbi:MAG TPA: hypothetical protein VGG42_17225 [Acidobacteriaceae bacterium]|jgi:hypothetical protein